jgi:hypothetical protein
MRIKTETCNIVQATSSVFPVAARFAYRVALEQLVLHWA